MSFRRPILSTAPLFERIPICRRGYLHPSIPAVRRRNHQPPQQQQQPLRARNFTTAAIWLEKEQPSPTLSPLQQPASSSTSKSKLYTYEDIVSLTESPDPTRILLIDVREPSELSHTGRIPTSVNIPLQSHPDFAFLPASEFLSRFGFPKPTPEQEVVFYCKAGVRSRAAAELARRAGWGKRGGVGEFEGSWVEWSGKGGGVER